MSPDRVKCNIGGIYPRQAQCSTHGGFVFGSNYGPSDALPDRCPIGRLEDLEARLDRIEDNLHEVTKALSERS